MTSFAYTDEQQIDELLNEILGEFDDSDSEEISEDLDSLLAQIRSDS
jgi:hypothetical protein